MQRLRAAVAHARLVLVAWGLRIVHRARDLLLLARHDDRRLLLPAWQAALRDVVGANGRRASAYDGGFDEVLAIKRARLTPDDVIYGEAFIGNARDVLLRAEVDASSVVVDLGCGRGAVLLAAHLLGARARGVDVLRAHIDAIAPAFDRLGIEVDVDDARQVALHDATHVWLAWATWSDALRAQVAAHLAMQLRGGAVVVTVVHALDEELPQAFERRNEMRAAFSWGCSDVFVSRRRQREE